MKSKNIILIINTALDNAMFLMLGKNEQIISRIKIKTNFNHAEKLLPAIERLLKKNQINFENLKAISIVRGPGHYTAIKLGILIVNVLGFILKIPVVGFKKDEFDNTKDLLNLSEQRIKKQKKFKMVEPYFSGKSYYEK